MAIHTAGLNTVVEIREFAPPQPKRRRPVCEAALSAITAPLFSLEARWRNGRRGRGIQNDEGDSSSKKTKREEGVDTDAFLQTLQSVRQEKKDRDLIRFFERLPVELRGSLLFAGTDSEQADAIRAWMAGVPRECLSQARGRSLPSTFLLAGMPRERLKRIERLDLSSCDLESIPEEIRYFSGLKELDLSHNKIREIDPVLGLPNLQRLLLADNEICNVPGLFGLQKLQYISLHTNRIRPSEGLLERFPETVRPSIALHLQSQKEKGSVPSDWQKVRYLPPELIQTVSGFVARSPGAMIVSKEWHRERYETLLERYQSSPLLKRFIDPFRPEDRDPRKTVLQVLAKVTEFLERDGLFENCRALDADLLEQAIKDRNAVLLFKALPDSVRQYGSFSPHLTGRVSLQATRVRSWMRVYRAALSRLENLDLSFLGLLAIPEEIEYFTGLRTLRLIANKLEDLSSLNSFESLISPHALENQTREIGGLGSLRNLTTLNLNDNRIGRIDELGRLLNLEHLFLSDNPIEDIGPISSLVNLRTLIVLRNRISDIAPLIPLERLTQLSFWQNPIAVSRVDISRFPEATRHLVAENLVRQDPFI